MSKLILRNILENLSLELLNFLSNQFNKFAFVTFVINELFSEKNSMNSIKIILVYY